MTPISSEGHHGPLNGEPSQQATSKKDYPLKQRTSKSFSGKTPRSTNASKRTQRRALDRKLVMAALNDKYLMSRGPGYSKIIKRSQAQARTNTSETKYHFKATKPSEATKRKLHKIQAFAQRTLLKLKDSIIRSAIRLSIPLLKLLQKRIELSKYSSSTGKRSFPRIRIKGTNLTLWEMIYSNWQSKVARSMVERAAKHRKKKESAQEAIEKARQSIGKTKSRSDSEEYSVEEDYIIANKEYAIPYMDRLQEKAKALTIPAKRLVRAFNETNHSGETTRQIAQLLAAHLVENKALYFGNASMLQSLIIANEKDIITSKHGSTIMQKTMSPAMQAHMNKLAEAEMVHVSQEFSSAASAMIKRGKACLKHLGYIPRKELRVLLSAGLTEAMDGNTAAGEVLANAIMMAI